MRPGASCAGGPVRAAQSAAEGVGECLASQQNLLRNDAAQVAQLLIPAAACALQQPERHGATEEAGALEACSSRCGRVCLASAQPSCALLGKTPANQLKLPVVQIYKHEMGWFHVRGDRVEPAPGAGARISYASHAAASCAAATAAEVSFAGMLLAKTTALY